jgi:hypothetical protein
MKFSSKEDLDAPIEAVFQILNDFETIERGSIRRGIDVRRIPPAHESPEGTIWNITYDFRGKSREGKLTLIEHTPPTLMRFSAESDGLSVSAEVELVALSKTTTRMMFEANLKPQSLPARLLIQSLRLAKSSLDRKFDSRFANFAARVEHSATKLA